MKEHKLGWFSGEKKISYPDYREPSHGWGGVGKRLVY